MEATKLSRKYMSTTTNNFSTCLTQIFSQNKTRNAIQTYTGVLTYSDLQIRVIERVGQLENLRIRPNSTVVIALPRSVEYVVSLIACFWIGARAFPVDPAEDSTRIMASIELSRAAAAILNSDSLADYSGIAPVMLNIDSPPNKAREISEYSASPILVTTTSGSTGAPKPVLVDVSAIIAGTRWAQKYLSLSPSDVHLFKTSVSFTSIIRQIFWPLLTGGCIAIVDHNKTADLAWIAESLEAFGVTIASFFPSHLELVLKKSPMLGGSMRHVLLGGEPLMSAFANQLVRSQGITFHNVYGMTECNVALVHTLNAINYEESTLPIGHPVDGTVAELEQREIESQELILRSPLVALGYLDNSLSSTKFLPADVKTGLRGYRTGDLVCKGSHGFQFVGRNDERTKLRGFSIDLAGVEVALKASPNVTEAAAAIRRNSTSDHRLEAFVVLNQEEALSSVEALVREALPDPMIPTHYHLVKSLPKLGSGKIDRRSLLKLYQYSPIKNESSEIQSKSISDGIKKVWSQLVGESADFFEGGGHSLLAVELCVALTDLIGIEPSPEIIYEHSNFEDFVKAIENLRENLDE